MDNRLKIGISFLAGLVIGGFATKKYLEYKASKELDEYEDYIEDEDSDETTLEDLKDEVDGIEVYNDTDPAYVRKFEQQITSTNSPEYREMLDNLRYTHGDEVEEEEYDETEETIVEYEKYPMVDVDRSKPYNISPDEFEEIDEYESDEYTYYADGYVTDSYGIPISEEDIVNTIGEDFKTYFGTYDNDQIWVRNERLSMDISVLKDMDNFQDVAPTRVKRMVGL